MCHLKTVNTKESIQNLMLRIALEGDHEPMLSKGLNDNCENGHRVWFPDKNCVGSPTPPHPRRKKICQKNHTIYIHKAAFLLSVCLSNILLAVIGQ